MIFSRRLMPESVWKVIIHVPLQYGLQSRSKTSPITPGHSTFLNATIWPPSIHQHISQTLPESAQTGELTRPLLTILPLSINLTPFKPRLNIKMHLAPILIPRLPQTRAPILAPKIIEACIHDHQRYRAARLRAARVRVRPASRQVVAITARGTAIGLPVGGKTACAEFCWVDGAGVEACALGGGESAVHL